VKFKPISGREDQAGGLVWRAKDPNNYYVARANALEDNGHAPPARGYMVAALAFLAYLLVEVAQKEYRQRSAH